MNKQYILLDDAAYVTNENGEIKETKKTNNLEEKLTKENELEEVENEINTVTKKLKDKKTERKRAFESFKTIRKVALFSIIVFPLFVSYLISDGLPLIEIVGSKYLAAAIITSTCMIPASGLISLLGFIEIPSKKEIKGLEKRVELLEQLKFKVLKELENIKSFEKEVTELEKGQEGLENVHFIPANSRKEEIELIRVYSTYLKRLNKLYKTNRLENFLKSNNYTEYQINYIKNLLEQDLSNENKYVDDSEVKSTKRDLKKERKTTKK